MTERIKKLCSLLSPADLFVDVGCDHGYCTEYMLKNGLCKEAIVTDVSKDCLKKAETLLASYIQKGVCSSLCTNGLIGVTNRADEVLIAGMGGMEILQILTNGFIPKQFVFQPMRDSKSVREYLLSNGCAIERDFTFFAEGKFYDVIKGSLTGKKEDYTDVEKEFGKENIQAFSSDFQNYLKEQIQKTKALLMRPLKEDVRADIERKIDYFEGVLSREIR